MPLDIARARSHFPALNEDAAHFDSPGGTQTPDVVADAMRELLVSAVSNRGTTTTSERRADDVVHAARHAMADLLGAEASGVVFGRSATALTFEFARTLSRAWGPGDEVVVSRLDHDANVRPWVLAAEARGARVRWIDFDPDTAELAPSEVDKVVTPATRLVALTGASNLIGTRPDLPAIAEVVHGAGAVFFVDGVHLTAHATIDLTTLGADVYVCSPYKFCGPHCGVLSASPDFLEQLSPDKLLPATDAVPERFELGTLPYEMLAGVTAAVDFLASFGDGVAGRRARLGRAMSGIEAHEERLCRRVETYLDGRADVISRSRAAERTPTLLLTFPGRIAADAAAFLAQRQVNAPAGSFYAYEPARRLGLGPAGGLRVGFAPYNDDTDVDRLLAGLDDFLGATHVG